MLSAIAGALGGQRRVTTSARRGQGKGTGGKGAVRGAERILGQREEGTQQLFRSQSRLDFYSRRQRRFRS